MNQKKENLTFPRILAVDLDGTLLRSDHTVSDRTVKAFRELKKRDCVPVICTGRSYEAVIGIKDRLGLDTPVICYNGAMICDGKDGTILHEWRLPPDITRETLEKARERDIHFQGFSLGQLYFEKRRTETEYYEAMSGLTGHVVNFDDWDSMEFTKAQLIGQPDRDSKEWPELKTFQAELKERFGDRLYTAFSTPFYLEMINGDSSKGAALGQIARDLYADPAQVAAFGDGFNDMEMLEFAGISVAMANAPEEIRKKTAFTTLGNNEDGVADFIEKNFLR